MDFRDALNIVTAELTPQPWDYTAPDGTTLTVIPRGWPEGPGDAEVLIRVTESHTLAAQIAITTASMPELLAALDAQTALEYTPLNSDFITLTPSAGGDVSLEVVEINYVAGDSVETSAAIRVPAGQRLPLASALRRALDVARGWES
jgi:hypothetical protein